MLVALVVLAVPPMLTNAYVAVDQVDRDAVEAARGMGMTALEVFWRVELPLAVPLMFAGIRTAVVYVIATATLAAIAGGGGLGDIIVNQASYGICRRARRRDLGRGAGAFRGHRLRRAPTGHHPARPAREDGPLVGGAAHEAAEQAA